MDGADGAAAVVGPVFHVEVDIQVYLPQLSGGIDPATLLREGTWQTLVDVGALVRAGLAAPGGDPAMAAAERALEWLREDVQARVFLLKVTGVRVHPTRRARPWQDRNAPVANAGKQGATS